MEAVAAVTYLMAGSDILIMRHPEAVRMVRAYIDALTDGGSLKDVGAIRKLLPEVKVDLAALAPAPDLTLKEEKKAGRTEAQDGRTSQSAARQGGSPQGGSTRPGCG